MRFVLPVHVIILCLDSLGFFTGIVAAHFQHALSLRLVVRPLLGCKEDLRVILALASRSIDGFHTILEFVIEVDDVDLAVDLGY